MRLDFKNQLFISLAVVGQKPTGLATYAINLLNHFPATGFSILEPSFAQPILSSSESQTIRRIPIPSNMSADDGKKGHFNRLRWTQFQLPRFYQKFQANLLFSPIPEAPLWAGCRSVVMVHDLIPLRYPNWRSPLYPYFRFYLPQVLRQAQHILCNSTATASEVMDFFGIAHSRITPIPLAYDAENFRPLGTPSGNYFVHLGRHDPHKNVGRIIQALAQLQGENPPELWLVGPEDSRYAPALKAQAEELGVGDRLKFLGYVPYGELPQIIGGAIALVFPSLWEGFGFPVLEAMACGTPVITSTTSALPEVAGDAAILVDPLNVAEMAAAMTTLATDSQAWHQLRAAGLARAQQFSWSQTAQRTVDVLAKYG